MRHIVQSAQTTQEGAIMNQETPNTFKHKLNLSDPKDQVKIELLENVPCPTVITTCDHEIMWYNEAFSDTYSERVPHIESPTVSVMLGCEAHPQTAEDPYGESCQDCPLFQVYQALSQNEATVKRGSLTVPTPWGNEEINIEVTARYVTIGGEKMYLLFIRDLECEVTRYELNRSFFHDLLNLGQQIRSSANLAQMIIEDAQRDGYRTPTQLPRELVLIGESVGLMSEMVDAQRQLNNAQNNSLKPNITELAPAKVLHNCVEALRNFNAAGGRLPVLVPGNPNLVCQNDIKLVQQTVYSILYSLVYASRPEHIIELGYNGHDNTLTFWFRDRELQLSPAKQQQFQRTFSFKRTRTIFSHAIEILLPYIQGEIALSSSPEAGTTISLVLPIKATISENDDIEQ